MIFTEFTERRLLESSKDKPKHPLPLPKPVTVSREEVRVRVLLHIILIHCAPTNAIITTALDLLLQSLTNDEARVVFFTYNAMHSLLHTLIRHRDDWTGLVLTILLDVVADDGMA